jgi:hypothetical protein
MVVCILPERMVFAPTSDGGKFSIACIGMCSRGGRCGAEMTRREIFNFQFSIFHLPLLIT